MRRAEHSFGVVLPQARVCVCVCSILCDLETWTIEGSRPGLAVAPQKKSKLLVITVDRQWHEMVDSTGRTRVRSGAPLDQNCKWICIFSPQPYS